MTEMQVFAAKKLPCTKNNCQSVINSVRIPRSSAGLVAAFASMQSSAMRAPSFECSIPTRLKRRMVPLGQARTNPS